MKFTHDGTSVSFPGIAEALNEIEKGTWKFFCMEYGRYQFIQVAYVDGEGFLVEARDGKNTDLVSYAAQDKETSMQLLAGFSDRMANASDNDDANKSSLSPSEKIVRMHIYVSLPPVILYVAALAYFGCSESMTLVVSVGFMGFSLLVYNCLFAGIRKGRFDHMRRGDFGFAEEPIVFFFHVIVFALISFGLYALSIFLLTR